MGRYYQFLSGDAATGAYLTEKAHRIQSNECWWCSGRERQACYHLLFRCRAWAPQSKAMWKSMRM